MSRNPDWYPRYMALMGECARLRDALRKCTESACPYSDSGACEDDGCTCGASVARAALSHPAAGEETSE